MPLPAGVGGGGTGPGGGLPITSRQRPLRVSYIDPDGETWDFSDLSGPVQVINVAGHGSPPVALTSLAMPSGASLPQNYTGSGRTILVAIVAAPTPRPTSCGSPTGSHKRSGRSGSVSRRRARW